MDAQNSEHHVMILDKADVSGGEEWYCPICSRRLLIHWPPNYKKVVLEPGDYMATHSGGTGGLKLNQVSLADEAPAENRLTLESENDDDVQISSDDLARLQVWEENLKKVDFEDWWR